MTDVEQHLPAGHSGYVERLVESFDHWDTELADDPFPVYEALRERCPVNHSEVHGGYWILSRYADIEGAARDYGTFSSRSISVPDIGFTELISPPLDLDPPEHTKFRQALLPYFSPGRTQQLEPITRAVATSLVEGIAERGRCDAAQDFAKHIPIAVLSHVLGVDPGKEELFAEWTDVIVSGGPGPAASAQANQDIRTYFAELLEQRRAEPQDDLVSYLVHAKAGDEEFTEKEQLGVASLLLIAGIDTTWCMLGNSLWWLAQDEASRRRLVEDPSLLPSAVEELLRRFAPVSVCRIVNHDAEVGGQVIPENDHVLLPFPAANMDPEVFPDPFRLQIDRTPNRHLAFGAGVHRCVGAHLARMELRVGLEEWLRRIPDFELDGPDPVAWKPGQIRGPSRLLLTFGT